MPTPDHLPTTDTQRMEAARYLHGIATRSIELDTRALQHDAETFARMPTLRNLAFVEHTCANLRRRLTRKEAFENILP